MRALTLGVVIRVIYRWSVDSDRRDAFAAWWHSGTLRIRDSQPGALGSALLRPLEDQSHLVAVARWESLEDLERFWGQPAGESFAGSKLESAEVFEELDDLSR